MLTLASSPGGRIYHAWASIKEVIENLSKTFLELQVSKEILVEEAVRQVSNLAKGLQMKVSYLEARMVPSTTQEVRDQREVYAKSIVATMSEAVE